MFGPEVFIIVSVGWSGEYGHMTTDFIGPFDTKVRAETYVRENMLGGGYDKTQVINISRYLMDDEKGDE